MITLLKKLINILENRNLNQKKKENKIYTDINQDTEKILYEKSFGAHLLEIFAPALRILLVGFVGIFLYASRPFFVESIQNILGIETLFQKTKNFFTNIFYTRSTTNSLQDISKEDLLNQMQIVLELNRQNNEKIDLLMQTLNHSLKVSTENPVTWTWTGLFWTVTGTVGSIFLYQGVNYIFQNYLFGAPNTNIHNHLSQQTEDLGNQILNHRLQTTEEFKHVCANFNVLLENQQLLNQKMEQINLTAQTIMQTSNSLPVQELGLGLLTAGIIGGATIMGINRLKSKFIEPKDLELDKSYEITIDKSYEITIPRRKPIEILNQSIQEKQNLLASTQQIAVLHNNPLDFKIENIYEISSLRKLNTKVQKAELVAENISSCTQEKNIESFNYILPYKYLDNNFKVPQNLDLIQNTSLFLNNLEISKKTKHIQDINSEIIQNSSINVIRHAQDFLKKNENYQIFKKDELLNNCSSINPKNFDHSKKYLVDFISQYVTDSWLSGFICTGTVFILPMVTKTLIQTITQTNFPSLPPASGGLTQIHHHYNTNPIQGVNSKPTPLLLTEKEEIGFWTAVGTTILTGLKYLLKK